MGQMASHRSIVACDQQPPLLEHPVPLTAGATCCKRAVAPKYHRPGIAAHAVVLEPRSSNAATTAQSEHAMR
jgi:hypothetical protein